jgi:hypothetical protein
MTDSLLSAGENTEAVVETEQTLATEEATQSTDRPEWLPEKYKSPEDLAKAYKELESKLGNKDEELRKTIMEELQADAYKDRPESAGAYELPEGIDSETAVDSELLSWWSEHAFENGYSQEEFQKGIEMYAAATQVAGPDIEAEQKRLGDRASDRIQSASMFANKFFPKETLPAIERMCETAEGIMALEHIIEATKDGNFSGNSSTTEKITEQSLREMMQDDRYHHPAKRDASFVRQVEDGFKKLYG